MSKPQAPELPADSWLVARSESEVLTMTLDELDAAFNAGSVSEDTLVWTHELDDWCALGQLLGAADDEGPESDAIESGDRQTDPRGVAAAAQTETIVPDELTDSEGMDPNAVQTERSAPEHGAEFAQSQGPSPIAPAATRQTELGHLPLEPLASPSASRPLSEPHANFPASSLSTAPVAFDPSLAVTDEQAFAPKKGARWGVLALAAVVAGGVGVTAMNLTEPSAGSTAEDLAKAAAAQPIPVATPDKDAPLAVGGGYQVTAAEKKAFEVEAEKSAKAKAEKRMREKMAAALEGKQPSKPKLGVARRRKSVAPAAPAIKSEKSSFDPLNGSLP